MCEHGIPDSRLTVIDYAYTKDGRAYWNCICDCGNKKIVGSRELRKGTTKSCGCLQKERFKKQWNPLGII